MTKDSKAKFLKVKDTSCTEEAAKRTHEIIVRGETIPVVFEYGKDTILPFEQGVKFMKDGFIVEEVDGSKVNLPAVPTDNVAAQLGADECVAKFTELNLTALKMRAAQRPGGEIYLEATEEDAAALVEFILGKPPEAPKAEDESLIDDDGEDEDGDDTVDTRTDEEKAQADLEAKQQAIIAHFSASGASHIGVRETDGAAIFSLVNDKGEEIVRGTFLELHEAVLKGVSADRYNADYAAANPAPEEEQGESGPKFSLDEVKGSTDEALELAVAHGIDIKDVAGTGEAGNVLKADVEAFITQHNIQPVNKEQAE